MKDFENAKIEEICKWIQQQEDESEIIKEKWKLIEKEFGKNTASEAWSEMKPQREQIKEKLMN